jgi:hypothetical protein
MALLVEIPNVVFRYYSRFAQLARMAHNAPVPLAQVFWHLCWRALVTKITSVICPSAANNKSN